MLGRSRHLRPLFSLCKRSLAKKAGVVPPPKTDVAGSGAAVEGGEVAGGGGGPGLGTLAAGAFVLLTGVAVYQNRELFHDYVTPPAVLNPNENLRPLPISDGTASASVATGSEVHEENVAPPAEVLKDDGLETEKSQEQQQKEVEEDKSSESLPENIADKPEDKTEATAKEVVKEDAIPPQIIDNSAIVELFSEALGQKAIDEGTSSVGRSSSIDDEVFALLKGDIDVSAVSGKLLASSVKEAIDTQPDWSEFKARHNQAEHDASVLKHCVERERESAKASVDILQYKIQDDAVQIKRLQESVDSTKQEMLEKVLETKREAEHKHKDDTRMLKEKLALEASGKSMEQTTQRIRIIDQLRERVNVLTAALTYWMNQTQSSTDSQKVALEAVSMDKLLDSDDSGTSWITTLSETDTKDPLLKAALACMPHDAVQSKRELKRSFSSLQRKIESLSLLPPSGGGLLAQMAASIGARLKIKVPETYEDANDVKSRLERVERALEDGSIAEAITLLTEITHDTGAVDLSHEWIQEAQKYAKLQEIRKILLARAQELTAAVSAL